MPGPRRRDVRQHLRARVLQPLSSASGSSATSSRPRTIRVVLARVIPRSPSSITSGTSASSRSPRRALARRTPGDGDVGRREPAVPEDDPLAVALPARASLPTTICAQLGVQRLRGQQPGPDLRPQRAEGIVAARTGPSRRRRPCRTRRGRRARACSSCRRGSGASTRRATPSAGSARAARAASPRRRCPRL